MDPFSVTAFAFVGVVLMWLAYANGYARGKQASRSDDDAIRRFV